MSMNKRKILKICISIFLFFVILAIIEITVRGISKGVSNLVTNIKEEKKEEEFNNSKPEVAKRNAKDFANNILKALADGDYDYVTYYLDDAYLKYFYDNDKEKAKEDLKNYMEDGATYQINNITDVGLKYYVSVGFTKEDIFHTKYLTIYDLDNGSYKIMFGHYNYIISSDYATKTNDLLFENTYTYSVGGTRVYPVNIRNDLDEEIEIEFVDVYTLGSTGTQRKCESIENIKIQPGEKQKIEVIVGNFTETIISLNFKLKINGTESTVRLFSNKSVQG